MKKLLFFIFTIATFAAFAQQPPISPYSIRTRQITAINFGADSTLATSHLVGSGEIKVNDTTLVDWLNYNLAAGSTGSVQYNDAGFFASDAEFTYNAGADILSIVNLDVDDITSGTNNVITIGDSIRVEGSVSITDGGGLLIAGTSTIDNSRVGYLTQLQVDDITIDQTSIIQGGSQALTVGTNSANTLTLETNGTNALQFDGTTQNADFQGNDISNITSATVDNILIDGNDISSSSGDITLTPTTNVDIASGDLDILGTGSLLFDGVSAINDTRQATLTYLDVDNIVVNSNTIQSQSGSLDLTSATEIYLNGSGVADSIAATRGYVDDQNKDAAGNNTEIQYNSSGKLAANSAFTFSTDSLYVDAQAKFHREVEVDRSLQVSDRDLGGGGALLRIRGVTSSSDAEIALNSQGTDIWSILNDAGTNDDFVINKSGAVGDALSIYADSANVQLDQYGSGNFGGTAAYNLEVDANGNIIETPAGGGGGGGGAGGATTQIQFNNSGALDGSADMTYDGLKVDLNATNGVEIEGFLFETLDMSSPNSFDIETTGASSTIDIQTGTTPTTAMTFDQNQDVSIPNGDLTVGSGDPPSVGLIMLEGSSSSLIEYTDGTGIWTSGINWAGSDEFRIRYNTGAKTHFEISTGGDVSISNGGLSVEDSISNGNSYVHLRSELGTLNTDQLFSSPNDIVMQIDNNNNGGSDKFSIYRDGSATDPTSGTLIFDVRNTGAVDALGDITAGDGTTSGNRGIIADAPTANQSRFILQKASTNAWQMTSLATTNDFVIYNDGANENAIEVDYSTSDVSIPNGGLDVNGDLSMNGNDVLSVSDLSNAGGNLNISASTIDLEASALSGLSLETLTINNSQITSTSGNLNLRFPSASDFVLTENGAEAIVVDGGTNEIELGGTSGNYNTLNFGILKVGSVGWSGSTGQSSEIQMEYGQIHTRANSDNDIRIAGGIRNDGTDWDHISTTKGSLGILGKNGLSLYHTTSSSGAATLGNALTFNNDGSNNWNIETANNIYFQENTAGTRAIYLRDGGTALTTGQQRQIVAQGQGSSTTHASSIGVYKNGSFGNLTGFWFADENDGTDHWTWYDNSGILRTSSSIGNVGSTTGTVIGTQTSDKRLKENIRDNPYGLETIKSLETHQYEKFGETELGFVAQEVDLVIPRSESKAVYDSGEPINGDTIFTQLNMDYSQIVPVLVKAIQEQNALIEDLNVRIEELETNTKGNGKN